MIFHSLQRQSRIFGTKRILVSKPTKGVSTSDIWITAAFTSLSGSMLYLNNI